MSGPRLLFLYPPLYQSLKIQETHTALRTIPKATFHLSRKKFHNTTRRREEVYAQRYGPAAEQLPPPIQGGSLGSIPPNIKEVGASKSATKASETKAQDANKSTLNSSPDTEQNLEPKSDSSTSADKVTSSAQLNAEASRLQEVTESNSNDRADKPLEKVLQMEAPTSTKSEEHKPPHLHTPPYLHNFDTFTLVKDLQKGGFTQDQSVTVMKAIRSLMTINLDVAKEGLISKSDVENVFVPSPGLLS